MHRLLRGVIISHSADNPHCGWRRFRGLSYGETTNRASLARDGTHQAHQPGLLTKPAERRPNRFLTGAALSGGPTASLRARL
jgi:hypothetical protein